MRRLLATLLTAALLAALQLAPSARAFELKHPCAGGSPPRAVAILEAQPRLDEGSGGDDLPERDEYHPLWMIRPKEVEVEEERPLREDPDGDQEELR